MKSILLPADTFIVVNKTILTEFDRRILINLYQPIIGANSISLYLSLWAFLDKNELFSLELNHHQLMTMTQFSLDDIIASREKLEGIGLIKTYYKKDNINNYVYELYSPLSPYEFFNNPILSTTLLSNIGKQWYDNLISIYKIPSYNISEYENISLSFNEVYSKSISDSEKIIDDMIGTNRLKIKLDNTSNINEILSLIPDDILPVRKITKEVKDNILKFKYIYNFTNEQMQEVIINSIDETKKINMGLLKNNCENFYKFENGGKLPTLIYKNQPEYLRKNVTDTSLKSKLIYQFENISPYEYLTNKNGGIKPLSSDLKIVSYLLVDLKMMPGVVNVLLDYVLKINNNKLNKNFIESIASQWIKNNIKTVEDAMKIAEKEYKSRKKIGEVRGASVKESIKPQWLDKDINSTPATVDEQKMIEELLSEFK